MPADGDAGFLDGLPEGFVVLVAPRVVNLHRRMEDARDMGGFGHAVDLRHAGFNVAGGGVGDGLDTPFGVAAVVDCPVIVGGYEGGVKLRVLGPDVGTEELAVGGEGDGHVDALLVHVLQAFGHGPPGPIGVAVAVFHVTEGGLVGSDDLALRVDLAWAVGVNDLSRVADDVWGAVGEGLGHVVRPHVHGFLQMTVAVNDFHSLSHGYLLIF